MSVFYVLLSVLCAVLCVLTIVLILLQKKRAAGWTSSAMTGMGGQSATYYDKNRGRTREGRLERYTKISGVAFIVLSLVLGIKGIW